MCFSLDKLRLYVASWWGQWDTVRELLAQGVRCRGVVKRAYLTGNAGLVASVCDYGVWFHELDELPPEKLLRHLDCFEVVTVRGYRLVRGQRLAAEAAVVHNIMSVFDVYKLHVQSDAIRQIHNFRRDEMLRRLFKFASTWPDIDYNVARSTGKKDLRRYFTSCRENIQYGLDIGLNPDFLFDFLMTSFSEQPSIGGSFVALYNAGIRTNNGRVSTDLAKAIVLSDSPEMTDDVKIRVMWSTRSLTYVDMLQFSKLRGRMLLEFLAYQTSFRVVYFDTLRTFAESFRLELLTEGSLTTEIDTELALLSGDKYFVIAPSLKETEYYRQRKLVKYPISLTFKDGARINVGVMNAHDSLLPRILLNTMIESDTKHFGEIVNRLAPIGVNFRALNDLMIEMACGHGSRDRLNVVKGLLELCGLQPTVRNGVLLRTDDYYIKEVLEKQVIWNRRKRLLMWRSVAKRPTEPYSEMQVSFSRPVSRKVLFFGVRDKTYDEHALTELERIEKPDLAIYYFCNDYWKPNVATSILQSLPATVSKSQTYAQWSTRPEIHYFRVSPTSEPWEVMVVVNLSESFDDVRRVRRNIKPVLVLKPTYYMEGERSSMEALPFDKLDVGYWSMYTKSHMIPTVDSSKIVMDEAKKVWGARFILHFHPE